jgi:hypothetical protein
MIAAVTPLEKWTLIRRILPLFLLALVSAPLVAQESYCESVTRGLERGAAFRAFCDWVVSFDTKLPNIIGNQATHRYSTEKGRDRELIDTTNARIAYVDGRPHFYDVEINHVRVTFEIDQAQELQLHGAWSFGDYGSDLRLLFGPHTYTHFSFAGESTFGERRVLAFLFDVPIDKNQRWQIGARQKTGAPMERTYPGYTGRVLLDAQTFDLVRFERNTTEVEKHFPLRYGSNEVDYRRSPLGDGTAFVLPTHSVVTFCHDDKHHRCEINETQFENWQKFGAKTRILTGAQPE